MTDGAQQGVVAALQRYWMMSLLIVGAVAALSLWVAALAAPATEATATIGLISPTSNNVLAPGAQGDATLARYTTQRARFVESDEVLGAVVDALGDTTIPILRSKIRASAAATSNVITIVASAPDASTATALATAVVDAYRSETERQISDLTDAAVASLDASAAKVIEVAEAAAASGVVEASTAATIGALQLQAADLQTSRALLGDGVEFVVAPSPASVVEPGLPLRELALGLLLGLAMAATAAWLRADRNRRVVDEGKVSDILQATYLGEIARTPRRLSAASLPTSDHQLAWTAISRELPHGLLVVQSVGDVSSALVTIGLAAAGRSDDVRTLVIDADVPGGRASELLGHAPQSTDRAAPITQNDDWADDVVSLEDSHQYHFCLLPSGPLIDNLSISPSDLGYYVAEWRSAYDYILVDNRADLTSKLAIAFASVADGLLIVVGVGAEEAELEELRRRADLMQVPVVGFVLAEGGRQPRVIAPDPGRWTSDLDPPTDANQPAAIGFHPPR